LSRTDVRFIVCTVPKVSDEHLATRRRQIVAAGRRCLARAGFHQTTMQDVFRESGLSAGAVYRYFPSKAQLVAAIADDVLEEVTSRAGAVVARDPLPGVVELVREITTVATRALDGESPPARLAIQVWGEAMVDEEMHDLAARAYRRIREVFVAYAIRATELGRLPSGTDPEAVAKVLFGLVPGYILQRVLLGDVDPASYAEGVEALLEGAVLDRASTEASRGQ
jgi:AcrR family transcriptional regulator